nr:nascent polypeptide-associated complex subunit beta-like [Ipomoea batatas]
MNVEKLQRMAGSVRTGGKGTMRRKKKAVHKATTTDDKRLQSTLKRIGVNAIPAIEEVNIFKEDVVIQFLNPKVQASIAANTWVVSGSPQTKKLQDILPEIIHQLGPDNLENLKKLAEQFQKQMPGTADAATGANAPQEDDDERLIHTNSTLSCICKFSPFCFSGASQLRERVEVSGQELISVGFGSSPVAACEPCSAPECLHFEIGEPEARRHGDIVAADGGPESERVEVRRRLQERGVGTVDVPGPVHFCFRVELLAAVGSEAVARRLGLAEGKGKAKSCFRKHPRAYQIAAQVRLKEDAAEAAKYEPNFCNTEVSAVGKDKIDVDPGSHALVTGDGLTAGNGGTRVLHSSASRSGKNQHEEEETQQRK